MFVKGWRQSLCDSGRLLLAAACLSIVALAGCPAPTPSAGPPAASPSLSGTVPSVAASPSAPPSPATSPVPPASPAGPSTRTVAPSTRQGKLNLAGEGPITLDPALAGDAGSASYVVQIFSGLIRFDTNMDPVPDVAASWDKSTDGMTYTFHLRQDVKFHDGTALKASDFKYSWERALNPASGSTTAGTYLNDIVGAADVLSRKAQTLAGARVVDDFTLEVKIDGPKAYFLDKMAYPTAFVVEQANVQSGPQWWQSPVGTGPFKLTKYQADQIIVLQRYADYYGDKAGIAEVDFKLLGGNPIQLYQQGDIDVSPVGAAYMGLVTDTTNPVSKELQTFPELSLQYLWFNAAAAPFDDVNVRQAFTYAVDKERVNALAAEGTVTTAYGILPPGMPGYDANLTGLRFDPAKAKALIAASKYGDVSKLPPIVLTTSGYGNDISGELGGIIDQWQRNLGVTVSVRQMEPQAFFYSLPQEKNNLFDFGWIADYPDPQDFLDILFRTGGQNNVGGYSNPELDALLDRAAVEPDRATRLKMYQDAENIVVEDAAALPLYFTRNYLLVKPYVKNYLLNALGFPQLNKVVIQK